jgi:hypothetical protein
VGPTGHQRVTNGEATEGQRVINGSPIQVDCIAIGVAIAVDYTLIRSLGPCNKLNELLNKAISSSKTELVSNELQEAFDYFRHAEKKSYLVLETLDNRGIAQHIKSTNI